MSQAHRHSGDHSPGKSRGGLVTAVPIALTTACLLLSGGRPAAAGRAATGCSPAGVRAALTSFAVAFSRGDDRRLDAAFAPAPLFKWYSSNAPGLRRTTAAEDRATLIAYFDRRHRYHDRLRVESLTFTGNTAVGGNFSFTMRRTADDYRDGAWFTLPGKGAAVCTTEPRTVRLIVLSLGAASATSN